MSTKCSICLEPYKDASSIPCGHIFCFPCLQGHIFKTSKDGLNATCPKCKADFAFVTPDATLVMRPLRKHMHATIRKVFVDIDTTEFEDLKAAHKKQADELKEAEKRIKELEKKLENSETKLKAAEKQLEDSVTRGMSGKRRRIVDSDDADSDAPAQNVVSGTAPQAMRKPTDASHSESFSWLLRPKT